MGYEKRDPIKWWLAIKNKIKKMINDFSSKIHENQNEVEEKIKTKLSDLQTKITYDPSSASRIQAVKQELNKFRWKKTRTRLFKNQKQ